MKFNPPKTPSDASSSANANICDDTNFADAMSDVDPLANDKVDLKKQNELDTETAAHRRQAAVASTLDETISLELLTSESRPTYCAPGTQKRVLTQLERGQINWEASLDLHGYTLNDAQRELIDFIELCRGKNIRCIRVITGKSASGLGKHPVLKSYVHHWLCHRADIKAHCIAQTGNGGAGAFMVLLKKQ